MIPQHWEELENALHRTFEFDSFALAMEFMNTCTAVIEQSNHHPEWKNIYNKVWVKLTTHDAGNTITEKDRKLASELERIYCQFR